MLRFWKRKGPGRWREKDPVWKVARKIVEEAIESGADAVEVALRRTGGEHLSCTLRRRIDGQWRDLEEPPTRLAVSLFAALIDLFAVHAELPEHDRLLKDIWTPEPIEKSDMRWDPAGVVLVIELGGA
jgi:hypothetical protein